MLQMIIKIIEKEIFLEILDFYKHGNECLISLMVILLFVIYSEKFSLK